MTVTCATSGCPCEGIAIEVPDSWQTCTCGGCGVELLQPPPEQEGVSDA